MKRLKQFMRFDKKAFFEEKRLTIKEIKETFKYENGSRTDIVIGATISLIIIQDDTIYESEKGVNLFEVINLKVNYSAEKIKQKLKIGEIFKLKTEEVKVVVYGQYQNQLSLSCENGIPLIKLKND